MQPGIRLSLLRGIMRTGLIGRDPRERAAEYYYLALCALEDGEKATASHHLRQALTLLQEAGATQSAEYSNVVDKLTLTQLRHRLAVA